MAIPVSLADAKRQLRYEGDEALSDDREAEIEGFIADAAAWVEDYTGHILVARDVTQAFAGFGQIQLSAWPVKPAAALAVAYTEPAAQSAVMVAARVDVSHRPARIVPDIYRCWPIVPRGTQVTVTVRAGYEPDDIPPRNLRRAMLTLIGGYEADHEGGDVFGKAEASAKSLCRNLRARRL